MSLSLGDALRLVELQPGRTYREVVDGFQVEVRVLDRAAGPELADHEMLLPWVDLPFTPVLTVTARPGILPLPDPPIIPAED